MQKLGVEKDYGRIDLTHNVSPRDVKLNSLNSDLQYFVDRRYQGFPSNSMEVPHMPMLKKEDSQVHFPSKLKSNMPPPLPPKHNNNYNYSLDQTSSDCKSNNLKKVHNHIEDIDKHIQSLKEEKKKKMLEQEMEKKQNLHQLKNYDPWGKPGGGAPAGMDCDDHRIRRNVEFEDKSLSSPGGGAPNVNVYGEIVTNVPGDPMLRFVAPKPVRTTGDMVDPIRYKQDPVQERIYSQQLDDLRAEQAAAAEKQRGEDKRADEIMMNYDPYGKPGGGAPNLTQYNQLQDEQRVKLLPLPPKLNTTDYDVYKQEDLTNTPYFDTQHGGYQLPLQSPVKDLQRKENTKDLPDSYAQPVNMQYDPSWSAKDPHRGPMKNLYFPFGSAGGGAPLRLPDGNIQTTVYGADTFNRNLVEERKKYLAAQIYHNELEREMIEQKLNRMKEQQQLRAPFGELSEVIRQGRVGYPKRDPNTGLLVDNHLPSTDVTNDRVATPGVNNRFIEPPPSIQQQAYLRTSSDYGLYLARTAQERHRNRLLDRLKEREEARKHQLSFETFWGKPGGGAPNREDDFKKINLNNSLYYRNALTNRNEYLKPDEYIGDPSNMLYVKNPIHSTHRNAYDLLDRRELQQSIG